MRRHPSTRILSAFMAFVLFLSQWPLEAIAEDLRSLQDGSAQNQLQTLDPIVQTTPVEEEEDSSGSIVDNVPVGDKYYTDNGLVLQVNADGKTMTVVDFINPSATSVTIPDRFDSLGMEITRIADLAFKGREKLEEVILSDNIRYIGDDVFSGCSNLRFNVYDNVNYLGTVTNPHFYLHSAKNTNCTTYAIPGATENSAGTKIVASYAFYNCEKLETIVIPESVVQVGFRALRGCDNLKSVTLPFAGEVEEGETNNHVGFAFGARTYGGNISFIPETLTSLVIKRGKLQKNALYGLDTVEHLGLPSMQQPLAYYYGGETYEDNKLYIPASLKSVAVDSGEIPEYAFYNCVALENVTLGNGVTAIGFAAFSKCSSLANITIPFVGSEKDGGSDTHFGYIFGAHYSEENSSYVPESLSVVAVTGETPIDSYAFYNCSSLTSIEIPDSVTSIGAEAFYNTGYCNNEANWKNGVLYIGKHLIMAKTSITGTCTIKGGTLTIADKAFYNCSSLTSIEIPYSVTSIGNRAFYNCSSLVSIEIPDSVTSIGSSAFYDCSSLTSINIPSGVTSIGSSAFSGCSGLTSIKIPDSVTSIGVYAFYGCSRLTSVTFDENSQLTSIGEDAFCNCRSLTGVYITDMAAWCGINFAGYCSNPLYYAHNLYLNNVLVTELQIPSSVTSIGDYAFYNCSNLTSIEIPDSVTSIGVSAFYGCGRLKSVTFDENSQLTSIGSYAFQYCNLWSIYYNDTYAQWKAVSKDSGWNSNTGTYVIYCSDATVQKNGTVTYLDENTQTLTKMSIRYCPELPSVCLQSEAMSRVASVTEYYSEGLKYTSNGDGTCRVSGIGTCTDTDIVIPTVNPTGDKVTSIDSYAFYNCSSLTSIEIPDSVTSIGDNAFYNTGYYNDEANWEKSVLYIGKHLIKAKTSIDSVYTIKEGTLTIASAAFRSCSSLTSIKIPSSVTSIGKSAFYGCSSLTSIEIPSSVTSIGEDAFYNTGYYKNDTNWENGVLYLGKHLIEAKTNKEGMYTIKNGTLTIADAAFYNCVSLSSIGIPDSVTSIGTAVFYNCSSLMNITIPSSVTSIGDDAFYYCSLRNVYITDMAAWCEIDFANSYANPLSYGCRLYLNDVLVTELKIPSSVTSIGAYAFYHCSGLTSIVIPDSVTSIGSYAFSWCSSLVSIEILSSVTSIGKDAFHNCNSLTGVYITDMAAWCGINFADGSSNPLCYAHNLYLNNVLVTELQIPSGVTSIGDYAFYNCRSLTSIEIPSGVTSIGSGAFAGCSGLTSIEIPYSVTSIGKSAFYGCSSLTSITIPFVGATKDGLTSTCFGHIFGACNSSESYVVPKSLRTVVITGGTSIDDHAFNGCKWLTSITIPNSVTSIGDYAFYNCSSLKTVVFNKGSKVQSIGSQAFAGTTIGGTESIEYDDGKLAWRYIQKAADWDGGLTTWDSFKFGDDSGVLYEMADDRSEFYVAEYNNKNAVVVIPELFVGRPVNKIYEKAFYNAVNVETITVPDTIHYIGKYTFYNCPKLTSIAIQGSDVTMERGMIFGCEALTTLTVPFLGNNPEDTENTYLGYLFGAKRYEENGEYVPASLKTVELKAATAVYARAFVGCIYLENVNLPEGVQSIGERAFANCIALKELVIPNTVTDLGWYILENCNAVQTITIGAGITKIPEFGQKEKYENTAAFGINKALSSLTTYVVDPGNSSFKTDERGVLYELHEKLGVEVAVLDAPARANLKDYVLPEHIVYIAPYAFAYNTTLRWIQLDRVRRIDKCAFMECSALIAAVFGAEKMDDEAKDLAEQYNTYVANKRREGEFYTQVIGEKAFYGCDMLQYANLWTDFIAAIGMQAFYDCKKLTDVRLSASVQDIGHEAFGGTSLERIVVAENNERYVGIDYVLYEKLEDGTYKLLMYPSHKITEAEQNYQMDNGKKYQTLFTLPSDVPISAVESYAFRNAQYLQRVILDPAYEMVVGDYAFEGAHIWAISIGEKVTSLGLIRGEGEYTVFSGCESLTSIEVDAANLYYSSKNGVLFDKGQTKLIKYPEQKAGSEYVLPDTVSVIASMAFKGNTNLVSVVVPSYVHTIGLEAFYGCEHLASIYFDHVYAPASVMENAFTTSTEVGTINQVMLCYAANYYENGAQGEFGWKNYSGYLLCDTNVVPTYDPEQETKQFYAVVVVDSAGRPVQNARVELIDPNGTEEGILAVDGIAMFYDTYGTEGRGFALDFENPYSMKVYDAAGEYRTFTNTAIMLDEDMCITYITLTKLPTVYGVNCNGEDMNSERVELNKASVEFTEILVDENGNQVFADQEQKVPVFDEIIEFSAIGYSDTNNGYAFVDAEGNVLDEGCGLYQNGVKIASVARTEVQGDGIVFYFRPHIDDLINEVDVEVRLIAVHCEEESQQCSTVLNVHIFDFYVDESEIDLGDANVNIDLGAAGDFLVTLLGEDGLKMSLGENVEISSTMEEDIITFALDAKKTVKKATDDWEKGFNDNNGAGKRTYRFQYTVKFKDEEGKETRIRYNISFTRETEKDGYYYYRCKIHDIGNGTRATDDNKIVTYYGLVNKPNLPGMDDRAQAKVKADLIFGASYAYVRTQCKSTDDIKKCATEAKFTEAPYYKPDHNMKKTSHKLDMSFHGQVTFKYLGDGQFRCTGGQVKASLVYTFTHDQQFVVWVIPVILHVEVKASGEIELTITVDEDQKVDWECLLTLEVDITASIGVGGAVASVGLYGNIGTVFVLEILPDFGVESWKIYGEVGAYAKVLWYKYQYRFTPDSWKDGYYIIKPRDERENQAAAATIASTAPEIASMYLADLYTSIEPEMLMDEYKFVIIDNELYKLCYADVSGVEGYDAYNYVKLALSKWDGEGWTTPEILDDNGLNDGDYMLYHDGEKLMMVYTQQTEKLTEASVNDVYASAKDLSVKVVELTGTNHEATTVSTRSDYAYLTQITLVDGIPTVVWAENADNNIFGVSPYNYIDAEGKSHIFETTANSIWMSQYVDGTWTVPEVLADGLSAITQLVINNDGHVAYIVDTNGDLADTTDRVMYQIAPGADSVAINDPMLGSIKYVVVDEAGFQYYYDMLPIEKEEEGAEGEENIVVVEELDGWRVLNTTQSVAIQQLPDNTPEEFTLVYDEVGNLYAVVYAQNKSWTEDDQKMTGSAIYGMFYEDGVWGQPVELTAFLAENQRYARSLTAIWMDGKIHMAAITVNADGGNAWNVEAIYDCVADLTMSNFLVDYQSGQVTFTITNTGARKTPVYLSLDGASYQLIEDELLSGASMEYTVTLPKDPSQVHTISVAMNETGEGSVYVEGISVAYSDVQPVVKQLLLGANDVMLLAVKNKGNIDNTGITVIRIGSYSAESFVSDALTKTVSKLALQAGKVESFTFVNEQGEIETAWAVLDMLKLGAIVYHELILGGELTVQSGEMISVYTIAGANSEPESYTMNNYAHLVYNPCQGVLADGETVDMKPTVENDRMEYDPKQEELAIRYFSQVDNEIAKLLINGEEISNEGYQIEKKLIGGQITIAETVLRQMQAGKYTVTLVFTTGELCEIQLKVLGYYTVTWINDGQILREESLRQDTILSFTDVLSKDPTVDWEYTFAGWDYTGDGVADTLSVPTEDMTCYAVWDVAPRAYTVTWNMTDAAGKTVTVEERYYYGDIPGYMGTILTPEGMQFDSWDQAPTMVMENVTYTAVYKSAVLIGDVNSDGVVNALDRAILTRYLAGWSDYPEESIDMEAADMNQDGKVNNLDRAILTRYLANWAEYETLPYED